MTYKGRKTSLQSLREIARVIIELQKKMFIY